MAERTNETMKQGKHGDVWRLSFRLAKRGVEAHTGSFDRRTVVSGALRAIGGMGAGAILAGKDGARTTPMNHDVHQYTHLYLQALRGPRR